VGRPLSGFSCVRGGHLGGGIIEKVSFRAQVREVNPLSKLRSVREAIFRAQA
jgi:hypothetical protein